MLGRTTPRYLEARAGGRLPRKPLPGPPSDTPNSVHAGHPPTTTDIVQFLLDAMPVAVLVVLLVLVGVAVAYAAPAYRERTLRGAGVVSLGFVALALLIGAYDLGQHLLGGDVYWPDTVGMVAVFGGLLVVVVGTAALVLGAAGVTIGAYVLAT
jgi:hypothetical protein